MKKIILTFMLAMMVSSVLYACTVRSEKNHAACSNTWEESPKEDIHEREPIEGPAPTPPAPPKPPTATLPQPNAAWLSVAGYSQSFESCSNLCAQYQQNGCSASIARQYCNFAISVDLNKDGAVQQSSQGYTPSGGVTCENSMRCFDVISECKCGSSVLNINACVSFYLEQVKQTAAASAMYSLVHDYLAPGCTVPSA